MSTSLPLDWSTGRRVAAWLSGIAGLSLLACAAVYASALLFLLLNRVDPRQAEFLSIAHYWRLYSDDPVLRRKLLASMVVAGVGLVVVLPTALVLGARQRRPLHGAARFATAAEIRQAGLLGACQRPLPKTPGILVGRYRGRFLALFGQLSVMLSASTRSGKGVGAVIPNLLNWPHSVVVLDIKGENYEITAGFRATHGQAVYAFSPFDDLGRSHRWNPLSMVRTDPLHRVGDLLTIGQSLYPNDGNTTSSEAFFNDQARNLFLGLGLLLLETPTLPRTIGEILRQASGKGQPIKTHLTTLIEQRAAGKRPLSEECVDALQRLLSNSENTLSSIVATLNAPLVIFADAIVDAATSACDFRLEDLRRQPISIYVRVPPNRLASARPLLNLFFSQLIHLNTQTLPELDPSLKLQCLLINDEFAALGRVGILASAIAFLAAYNLRLLTIVQAMSQLDALYGDKEARTFATNHGLQILYAPREQRDAEEYSAMLGQFTERSISRGRSQSFSGQGHRSVSRNESDQRRPLLLPQEFKELGSERLVLVLENCKPILGQKIRYYREKEFRERLRPPPPVPRMDMDLHLAKAQQRWRYLDEELPPGETLEVESLAVNIESLPDMPQALPEEVARAYLDFLAETHLVADPGGTVEPVSDEDGVLIDQAAPDTAPEPRPDAQP